MAATSLRAFQSEISEREATQRLQARVEKEKENAPSIKGNASASPAVKRRGPAVGGTGGAKVKKEASKEASAAQKEDSVGDSLAEEVEKMAMEDDIEDIDLSDYKVDLLGDLPEDTSVPLPERLRHLASLISTHLSLSSSELILRLGAPAPSAFSAYDAHKPFETFPALDMGILGMPPPAAEIVKTEGGNAPPTGSGPGTRGHISLSAKEAKKAMEVQAAETKNPAEDIRIPESDCLSPDEYKKACANLERVVSSIGAGMSVLLERTVEQDSVSQEASQPIQCTYAHILARLHTASASELSELRMAVVGNVDAGKSTLLGVLTRAGLDDGRGAARVALFRHQHEIDSGRTSSVGMEIMGWDDKGRQVVPGVKDREREKEKAERAIKAGANPKKEEKEDEASAAGQRRHISQAQAWDEVVKGSSKVVSFIDLAGHEKYLKTTLFGLTGCAPDFVTLMIGANAGLVGMCKEHLSVAIALAVPIIVVVTKIDMTPPHVLADTLKQLTKILRSPGCRKQPVFVPTSDKRMQGWGKETAVNIARTFVRDRLCPVFLVSNVTGQGLQELKTFYNVLPIGGEGKYDVDRPLEFSISDVFSVPFVGTVVSGVVLSGTVRTGDAVLLGPDSLGNFQTTVIKSIERKRAAVDFAEAGQSVSFALKRVKRSGVRKGMVVMSKDSQVKAHRRFEGHVLVLYHNTTIQRGYQSMLHSGAIRQTVKILSISTANTNQSVIRTGDRATVQFEFVSRAEFIKEGQKLLFREGKTKGLGVVTKVGI